MNTTCVTCSESLTVRDNAYPGEVVACPSCSTELEVTSTSPMTLAVAPEPDEDWGE